VAFIFFNSSNGIRTLDTFYYAIIKERRKKNKKCKEKTKREKEQGSVQFRNGTKCDQLELEYVVFDLMMLKAGSEYPTSLVQNGFD
jgi:hypothetical protein